MALAALACLASACRLGVGLPQTARTRMAADRSYAPRPHDYPIFLTEGDVQEPYEVLGTAQSRSCRENEIDALGPAELRQSARQMGGDAVIHVAKTPTLTEELGYRPGSLSRTGTRFVTQYVMSGTVIRFVRDLPSAPEAPKNAPAQPPPAAAH